MSSELPQKLSLQSIRDALIRQEDTIIFALIERAQFRANTLCYTRGAPQFAGVAGPSESFLESMLLETERSHARVRRYTAPDEHAFFPQRIPAPALPLIEFPALLHPCNVNLNAQILQVYLSKVVPAICAPGDDEQHGSSVVADVNVLQAISKRVHYGLFVAESKFRSQPEEYTRLIEAGDETGIMALLTNMAVEEKVIRRVRRKAQTFGQDVQDADMPAAQPDASSLKLDPEHIVKLYHDFIIPLTKEAEVAYLMQRLGNTRVAFQGAADGSCYHLAVQHFDHMARAMPETMCYHSGCIACHLPGIDRCHWLRMFDDMNGLLVSSASQASGLLPCESSLGVFEALMSNRAFLGLVVLEKADSGILPATRALLGDYPLKVVGELVHTASYRLVSFVPLRDVRRVCGGAAAIRSCGSWVRQHVVPSCELVEKEDTDVAWAGWKSRVNGSKAVEAGVASESAVTDETAWLVDSATPIDPSFTHFVDVHPVDTPAASHTRCIVLCKRTELPPACGSDKTMLLFRLTDKPGNLAAALATFTQQGVNVTYIQSSTDAIAGEVCFFVELAGHARETAVAAALSQLASIASYLKILGSYKPGTTSTALASIPSRGFQRP